MAKVTQKEKEVRELAKWEKELARPKGKFYVWYLLLIITLIYIIDEVTSTIGAQMQTEIAIGLFQDRLSIMSLLTALSLPILVLAIFYKTLADKYGRKLFLVINTLGMGVGMFLIFLAGAIGNLPGVVVYVLATIIVNFFIPHDMQVVYIMETSPEGKRATTFAVVKALATLGIVLVPAMRRVFMGDDITKWNLVYLVPAIVAMLVSFIALLFARESEVFLRKRIAYLKMTDEEREAEIEERSKEAQAQGGMGNAFKFAFRHKQLRWLFITSAIIAVSTMGTNYYAKIGDLFYTTSQVTTMLFLYPFGSAFMTMLNGILGDRIGRKKTQLIVVATAFLSFTLFFVGVHFGLNPALAGLLIGLYIGATFASSDNIGSVMTAESSPTNLRASIMSAQTVMFMAGMIVAMIIPTIVLLATNDNYNVLGWLCILVSAPAQAITLVLFSLNVKDTTHVDLNLVRGDEWD